MFPNLKDKRVHLFWNNQPVQNTINKKISFNNVNDPIKYLNQECVSQQQTILPNSFYWKSLDINNDKDLNDVYTFLENNYHDQNDLLTFKYSKEILKWFLLTITTNQYILTLQQQNNIVGLITMITKKLSIYNKPVNCGIINFLCVHKSFREKGFVPLLITEITRLANLDGIQQALYTSGHLLINPISSCTYYHRPINIKKLIEIKFVSPNKSVTNSMMCKLYKIPSSKFSNRIRKMEHQDLEIVFDLYTKYISKFKIHFLLTKDEFYNWFCNLDDTIYSYVITNEKVPTDFISFFKITSNINGNYKYDTVDIAYPSCIISNTIKLSELMNELLVIAKQNNFECCFLVLI